MTEVIREAGYYLIDRIPYPSVTTILRCIAKPNLTQWLVDKAVRQAREDALKGFTEASTRDALNRKDEAKRGSRVHELAAKMANGVFPSLKDTQDPYFRAVEGFLKESGIRPVYVEAVVWNEMAGYAGTADLIGLIGKEFIMVDWKTSQAVYPEYRLQLAAYAWAQCVMPDRIPEFVGMPRISKAEVVLLRPDGTYSREEIPVGIKEFEAFKAAKTLFDFLGEFGK